jgi:hypothetical protein
METETGHTLTVANWEVPAAIRWPDLTGVRPASRCCWMTPSCRPTVSQCSQPATTQEVRRLVRDHTRKCDACLQGGPAAEAQAVERGPPVVFVEGFLVFANRELVELLDRRVLVVIGRAEARQRRLRTSGTTGLYFDRLIWPHCVDYTRQVLAAELQQPRQSEGGDDGPGTDLLVLSGEDAMDENVRRLAAFVEGSGRLIEPMTEGAAKLVAQLRAGNDQGETDASPPTVRPSCAVCRVCHVAVCGARTTDFCPCSQVENADGLSEEQRTALKLYRDAEVLEAYGKRTEATALYRRVRTTARARAQTHRTRGGLRFLTLGVGTKALRLWPDVEEAASRDGDFEAEHS